LDGDLIFFKRASQDVETVCILLEKRACFSNGDIGKVEVDGVRALEVKMFALASSSLCVFLSYCQLLVYVEEIV
jgi:hypothetical protein